MFSGFGFDGDDPASRFATITHLNLFLLNLLSQVFFDKVSGVEHGVRRTVVVVTRLMFMSQ